MDTNSNGARVTTKRKETFQCIHCNELFTANKNLRRHTKKFHVGEELPVVRMGRTPKTDMSTHNTLKPQKSSGSRFMEFHCALCNKYFTASKNLKRHMSRSHVNSGVTGMKQNECKRPYNASAHQIRRLSNVVMEFDSFTEFEEWKKQEEDAVVARFVKVRGDLKKRNGTIIKAFYCHRSGRYIPLLHQRKRYVKIQGSCKTGVVCPAAMIVKILVTGQVQLSYCAQHCDHQLEVAHIGLRQEDRAEIARKLAAGIPFQDVLDTWYVNSSNSNINRKSLLTNKDLANICVEFGLNMKEMLHTNDAESVAAWIELTKQDPASREVLGHEAAPHITESQAIFNSLGRQNSDGDVERLLALCDTTYSFLRSAMQQNLQLAELTYSNLSRLKALHAAMMNKPQEAEQARLPKIQNLEPANKKITTQRSFRSLCRSKKRSTPVSVCKPTDKETEFLLKSLDGNVPIVSTQPSVEHDYAYDTQCQVINFEHSYTSRR